MTRFLTNAALLAALCATLPAHAKDHSWAVGKDAYHVYYRDLDLTQTDGRKAMLARIEAAAGKLCATRTNLGVDFKACVKAVVDAAAPKSPPLRLALRERDDVEYAAR